MPVVDGDNSDRGAMGAALLIAVGTMSDFALPY